MWYLATFNQSRQTGSDLKIIRGNYGLLQLIRDPMRQQYLLDLYLSDIPGSKIEVGPYIADHKFVTASIPIPEIQEKIIQRFGFRLEKADWKGLNSALEKTDWQTIKKGSAADAFSFFMETLWYQICTFIPYEELLLKKKSHPWLDEKCATAIQKKNAAEGTPYFDEERQKCQKVIAESFQIHLANLKEKISKLKKGSKQWWRLNRELLERKSKISSIPPLKDNKNWITESKGKADTLAKCFAIKANLPDEFIDCPFFGVPDFEYEDFIVLRSRYTRKLLETLKEDKATGPDRIPASILKRIAHSIAVPFTMLCRRLLTDAHWPKMWKIHSICPLYKRGSAFIPGNYRGIHLTAILSKLAERIIGRQLMRYLQIERFGVNQWAFTPGLGARDLVTALVMSWILGICTGHKIGSYLSDITGAFDRVCKDFNLAKLHAAGVGPTYLNFLDAYLQPRTGQVVVEGEFSDEFEIANTVFQGTVLGSCLWNVFFADVTGPAASTGGDAKMFADDLNVFQKFDQKVGNEEIVRTMGVCRERVHKWGRVNRVSFDAGKEHIVILHPIHGQGDPFKLLGCTIDCKLVMQKALEKILAQMRPKIKAILRMRQYYDVKELISQFKTHIWGIMETHNGAIFHASSSILSRLDDIQRQFLKEIGETERSAFLDFNFAPPLLRRNIGILGVLHKRVIGKSHPIFQQLLPFQRDLFQEGRPGDHNKQLYGHMWEVKNQRGLHDRSIFAMVHTYNNLPQKVVDCASVSEFQTALTKIVRANCEVGLPDWQYTFDCRRR